jgi:hypothetical protein
MKQVVLNGQMISSHIDSRPLNVIEMVSRQTFDSGNYLIVVDLISYRDETRDLHP